MNWTQLKRRGRALWAWLLRRWLYVIVACVAVYLLVGALGVLKTQETKQVAVEAVEQNTLNKKQIRVLKKTQGKLQDSIRIVTIYKDRWHIKADSTAVVARKADAKVDSLLRVKNPVQEENPTDEYVRVQLENYKPKAYLLPGGDSLR